MADVITQEENRDAAVAESKETAPLETTVVVDELEEAARIAKEKKKASGMSVKHEYVSKLEQLADASGKSEEKTVSRKKRTEKEDKEETVYEISDLAYHVLVLMVSAGITVEDVTRELEKRHAIDHKVKQERMQ